MAWAGRAKKALALPTLRADNIAFAIRRAAPA
jgi:hypothetical protein